MASPSGPALRVHVHEHEAAPDLAFEREERELARIESFRRTEIARAREPAVERVFPGMVAADNRAGAMAAAVFHQRPGAMTADIVERADHAILAAHRDDRIAREIGRQIVARPRQLVLVREQLPGAREDFAPLGLDRLRDRYRAARAAFPGRLVACGSLSPTGRSCESPRPPLTFAGNRYFQPESPMSERFEGTARYVATDDLRIAVNAAITLQRPLLIKGEPGTGKTQLAYEVSDALGAPLITWHVKSTTKAQQGLYEYDAVTRLRD